MRRKMALAREREREREREIVCHGVYLGGGAWPSGKPA